MNLIDIKNYIINVASNHNNVATTNFGLNFEVVLKDVKEFVYVYIELPTFLTFENGGITYTTGLYVLDRTTDDDASRFAIHAKTLEIGMDIIRRLSNEMELLDTTVVSKNAVPLTAAYADVLHGWRFEIDIITNGTYRNECDMPFNP